MINIILEISDPAGFIPAGEKISDLTEGTAGINPEGV